MARMKVVNREGAFALGRVVVPARDGMLRELGHDVAALGNKALGFVVESRGGRALVDFPAMRLRLWLPFDELADVEAEAATGRAEFVSLIPVFSPDGAGADPGTVWWAWHLFRSLPSTHLLALETGPLSQVWDESGGVLGEYYTGPVEIDVAYIGIGVRELVWNNWERLARTLGNRLLFARFLPAGLAKLEIAIYMRR